MVTGDAKWSPWNSAQSFVAVVSPEVDGYTPNKKEIPVQSVDHTSKNVELSVTYSKNAEEEIKNFPQ